MISIIVIDYGDFTCSYEADNIDISIHYNTFTKRKTVHLTCTPQISVLVSHIAQVYIILGNKKVHLGRMCDALFATDTCMIVIEPAKDTFERLTSALEVV